MKLKSNNKQLKFIFLFGISVRSGTNFSSKIFSKHPDVEVIPSNETIREFPLLKFVKNFKAAFENFENRYINNNGVNGHYTWQKYSPYFGESFLNYIQNELVKDYSKNVYFIKDPGADNLKWSNFIFPNSKIIVLIRDGRDLVESSEKAYMAKRNSQSKVNRIKRHFFHFTGREFRRNVKTWANNALIIKNFLQSEPGKECFLVKYEDLVSEKEDVYKNLFNYCGLSFDMSYFKNVEIVGSSFSNQITSQKIEKIVWQPIKKTEKFKPVGRWKNWPKWKIKYFNKHAGELLEWFEYK